MSSEDETQRLPRAMVNIEERLEALEKRVQTLERKFDERGYDTRPVFAAHDQRIAALEAELTKSNEEDARDQPPYRIGNLAFENGLYWAFNDGVPFCPQCFEGKPHEKRHLRPISGYQDTMSAPIAGVIIRTDLSPNDESICPADPKTAQSSSGPL